MNDWVQRNKASVLAVLVALLTGASICVAIEDGDVKVEKQTTTAPATIPGVVPDADQQVDAGDLKEASAKPLEEAPHADAPLEQVGPEIHEDAKDETPPGITENEAQDAEIQAPGVGEPLPVGGAQNYACTPHYVVNQSPLSGARSGVALHFTVSSPGSLQAIWRLFNTPSFGASSNYGIELDGECEIWVAISRKGWAQGAFNSAYISIEIVTNDLSRSQWLAAEIIRDGILASLVADLLRQVGAPPNHVDPEGCVPKAGVTDHNALECGNTHWDVGPGFPWDVFMDQVRNAYRGADPVCDAACHRLAYREAKHRKTHKHYARHVGKDADPPRCRAHVHEVKARELRNSHCRDLKEKIHRQHAGIRRAKRAVAES